MRTAQASGVGGPLLLRRHKWRVPALAIAPGEAGGAMAEGTCEGEVGLQQTCQLPAMRRIVAVRTTGRGPADD